MNEQDEQWLAHLLEESECYLNASQAATYLNVTWTLFRTLRERGYIQVARQQDDGTDLYRVSDLEHVKNMMGGKP